MRKFEYATTQNLRSRNPSLCLRKILKDKNSRETLEKEVMVPYWETTMSQNTLTLPGVHDTSEVCHELWDPVTEDEIRKCRPDRGTAPVPDGMSARMLRSIPLEVLIRIFNIFVLIRKLPEHLVISKTTLIPKKENARNPGEFRPLTVSSVIPRAFHKILASRVLSNVHIDKRQKAFQQIDRCAKNVFIMDLVLRRHRQQFKSVYTASLDMAKAFDSVSHDTIRDTMTSVGFPDSIYI